MRDRGGETRQSEIWRGEFGDAYTERNVASPEMVRARVALWSRILGALAGAPPRSILEVGANIGVNLRALTQVTPAELFAVEPNARARGSLVADAVLPQSHVRDGIATELGFADGAIDLVFTSGVLIHVHPDHLLASCGEMHRVAGRYIACIEYFSEKPEEIGYRGHRDVLFKRDFGGFWLDEFPDLEVRDYGFAWKRLTGLDNLTWWLFEKRR